MKSKFFLSLLTVLTIATFTSNASAATCNYTVSACAVGSDVVTVGSTTGCKTYGQMAFGNQCFLTCSTCSSGYTNVANTYRDSSGCTIVYNTCEESASDLCATTTATILKTGYSVISSAANCASQASTYRCTTAGDCVQDCETCDDGSELIGKKVSASTGCYMTYDGCPIALGAECTTDSDCYGSSPSIWEFVSGRTDVQSKVSYTCQFNTCAIEALYRCAPGYAGSVTATLTGELNETCSVCESGYYSVGGASECTACPDGSFTNATTGAISCTSCVTATGNEAATSVAPAITSESCFLPAGTQMSSDETGTEKLIEDCYYESD